jgi:hypothetical protein
MDLAWLITTARVIPIRMAIPNPIAAALAVRARPSRIWWKFDHVRNPPWTTCWGGGSRKRREGLSRT